ncbi:tripartite tricarboxylate transporter substrate-binding protein [Deinococcus deserti]|uniref:Putative Bug family protein n=1 Tax=Deinococcus deserti (strain DSM 17065 / CIP 109153 / LMG 22923 / VCD115) TaxID=546414 RepID=C1D490_DEIDV|nr:tripartite tricarboxylate transporter substrate-binding protein [Deinococcus deserti]ACO47971.1 putative Bug family protein, precursor [Deinococcus deserti VCD115]
MTRFSLLAAALLLLPLSASAQPLTGLRIMAPASPGGGWDQTSRAIQSALHDTKLAQSVQVFNVSGAGGTIGLAQFNNAQGDNNLLMAMGLIMVGAIETNKSKATLETVTPIARLTGEYEVLVVPAASPYKNLRQFVAAWKANPRLAIAGGSAGGTDHMLTGLLAEAAGIDPANMNYVAYSGGGESLTALLGNQVAAGVNGYNEMAEHINSGKLRLLGISSKRRIPGIIAPTFREQGLNVEMLNWRGVVAAPGISPERRKQLIATFDKLHASKAWKDTLRQRKWVDMYLSGEKFDTFLTAEQTRARKVLKSIGLVK